MKNVIFTIDIPELQVAGSSVQKKFHLDEQSLQCGAHTIEFAHGIDCDLVLTNAGEGILVTGIVHADGVGVCDRCLEDAYLDISAEVDEYYLFEEPELTQSDDDDIDYSLVEDQSSIDVSSAIQAAIVMEVPFILLCDEACKGLCPHCGVNHNVESCSCEAQALQAHQDASPFAKLKELNLND